MIKEILMIVLGFVLLIKGADLLVDGASSVAKRFRIPEIVIGLTIVSIGTSMPELFVSTTSAIRGSADMSIGNREIFGPVTVIKRVKDFDEGLAVMNANPFANGSVIFTQNGYYARQFELLTDGGRVGINVGIPVPSAYFPFSGNTDSFFGDQHVLGLDGVRFYTRAKTVTKHWYDEHSRKKSIDTWEGTVERI